MTSRRKWQLVALAITVFIAALFSVPAIGVLIDVALHVVLRYPS